MNEERARALHDALLRRAARARTHPLDFFNFVWRDELTKEKLTATPHQRVFFKFTHDHPLCCIRMPPGFSKTTAMLATGLYHLGRDPTSRGAFLSATEDIAKKPVGSMADIIEHADTYNPELRIVFPELRPSPRPDDPWSPSKFVLDRPPGIRDASVSAYGVGSAKLIGSRLAWIVVDDILTLENTLTKEQRDYTKRYLMQIVKGRLDPIDGRCCVTNVPYDEDDLTYFLERPPEKEGPGWPTLTMNAEGEIRIENAPDWDCDDIRPSAKNPERFRLVAHDDEAYDAPLHGWDVVREVCPPEREAEQVAFDLDETIPLWPERFPNEELQRIKGSDEVSGRAYSINFKMKARDEKSGRCPDVWVTKCKEIANAIGHHTTLDRWDPRDNFITVTGIDVGGLGLGKTDDESCLFTYACLLTNVQTQARLRSGDEIVLRAGSRLILDVEYGKWRGGDLIRRIIRKLRAFSSTGRVEKNAESALKEWAEEVDALVPLSSHTTGMNKHHVVLGVEGSVLTPMEKGLWLIPNREGFISNPHLQKWVDACKQYVPPPAHTDDGIMAAWFAVEEQRSIWVPPLEIPTQDRSSFGISSLFAR